MKHPLTRRVVLAAMPAAGSLILGGCGRRSLPPTYGSLYDFSNTLTFAAHRLLLRNQPLVREFRREQISRHFPAINTTNPPSERYQRWLAGKFTDWRLAVRGLVAKPGDWSLDAIQRLPTRTQ